MQETQAEYAEKLAAIKDIIAQGCSMRRTTRIKPQSTAPRALLSGLNDSRGEGNAMTFDSFSPGGISPARSHQRSQLRSKSKEIIRESVSDPVGPEFIAPAARSLTAEQFMPASA